MRESHEKKLPHRRRWRGRCRRRTLAIHQVFQFLAGFEEWDLLGRNLNSLSGLGVAAHAGLALAGAKAAKSADFDLVARAQRAHDAVEDGFNNHFAVFAGQFRETGDLIDQIRFCHCLFAPRLLWIRWSEAPAPGTD